MKKLFSLLLIIGFVALGYTNLQAQCTPDPNATSPGIYPASVPDGCLNQPYSQVITVVVPADTIVSGITVPIDSFVIDSVVGLPTGITAQCNPNNCSFPGGTSNCILLSGTPTVATTFTIDVYTTAWVNIFGTPTAFPVPQLGFYTIEILASPVGSISTTPASCGAADGMATVTAAGPTPYTYLWSNGDTTATSANLMAGAYSVTVTNGAGCSETTNVVIASSGNNPEVAVDSLTWSGCAGNSSGGIYITAVGGTAPLGYSWSNGATTDDITGLAGGIYTVTVTDAAGCTVTEDVTLTEPAVMVISDDGITDVSCAGVGDGSATVGVTGGQGPYSYAWDSNPVQTTATASGLSEGTFVVTVIDDLGCMADLSFKINEPDSLSATLTVNDETTLGFEDGSANVVASGGTAPYTYSWSTGSDSIAVDSLAPGSYSVTVLDANGCANFSPFDIVEGPVSIEDELNAGIQVFSVFPNPNQGTFTIDISLDQLTELNVRVMDMNGRTVMTKQVGRVQQWKETISINDYAAGIYQLILDTPQGSASRRIMMN